MPDEFMTFSHVNDPNSFEPMGKILTAPECPICWDNSSVRPRYTMFDVFDIRLAWWCDCCHELISVVEFSENSDTSRKDFS